MTPAAIAARDAAAQLLADRVLSGPPPWPLGLPLTADWSSRMLLEVEMSCYCGCRLPSTFHLFHTRCKSNKPITMNPPPSQMWKRIKNAEEVCSRMQAQTPAAVKQG